MGIDAVLVNFNDVCCHDAKDLVGVIVHLAEFRLRWGEAKEIQGVLNVGHDIKPANGFESFINRRNVTIQGVAVGCDDNLAAFFFDGLIN